MLKVGDNPVGALTDAVDALGLKEGGHKKKKNPTIPCADRAPGEVCLLGTLIQNSPLPVSCSVHAEGGRHFRDVITQYVAGYIMRLCFVVVFYYFCCTYLISCKAFGGLSTHA